MRYFKSKWIFFGVVGCLLLLTLCIAFADDSSNPVQPDLSQPGRQEILEARTQHSKAYRNDDGTTSILGAMLPMHYKDENGKWQEIDTTIEDGTGEKDEDGETYGFKSDKNTFRAFIARHSQAGQL